MSSFFSRGGHSWRIARGYLEKCPEERKIVESLSFLLPVLKVIIRTLERLFKNLEKKLLDEQLFYLQIPILLRFIIRFFLKCIENSRIYLLS